jgi:hypothetical protein
LGEHPGPREVLEAVVPVVIIMVVVGTCFFAWMFGEEGLPWAFGEFINCDSWSRVALSVGIGILAAFPIVPLIMDTEFPAAALIYAVFALVWFAVAAVILIVSSVLVQAFSLAPPEPTTSVRSSDTVAKVNESPPEQSVARNQTPPARPEAALKASRHAAVAQGGGVVLAVQEVPRHTARVAARRPSVCAARPLGGDLPGR